MDSRLVGKERLGLKCSLPRRGRTYSGNGLLPWKPQTRHRANECGNGFPDLEYKPVTEAEVQVAKRKASPAVAVAVIPTPSCVIGTGTNSDEYVAAPFSTPHFLWDCLLDCPNCDTPLRVKTLIDHGSHLVLIRPELVDRLGLRHHSLPKPETVSTALESEGGRTSTVLTEWVKLRPSSVDSCWTSLL